MNNIHAVLLIAVVSAVTMLLRFLPLWIFGNGQKTPVLIQYLGKVLPYAIMGRGVERAARTHHQRAEQNNEKSFHNRKILVLFQCTNILIF